MDGVRREVIAGLGPPPSVEASGLLEPPAGLSAGSAGAWRELAPHAIAQLTLVPATVRGFVELVEQLALKQEIATAILKVGAATSGMDALLRHYAKLSQRVDASLARYRLTAAGKPEPSAGRRVAVNPWAAVAGKR